MSRNKSDIQWPYKNNKFLFLLDLGRFHPVKSQFVLSIAASVLVHHRFNIFFLINMSNN